MSMGYNADNIERKECIVICLFSVEIDIEKDWCGA